MSDMGESLNRKGDGWKGYKDVGGVGGGSEVAWENHGASVELGSALGPKRHIDSTSS
jgi:hypothetical protein